MGKYWQLYIEQHELSDTFDINEGVGIIGLDSNSEYKDTFCTKIKITAIRKADYKDLQQKYENPIQHACDIQEGQVFIANGWQRPEGMCESAWESISPFVMTLAHGGENIYDGWMKDPKSAMISCNDGFRPVSFLIEVINE